MGRLSSALLWCVVAASLGCATDPAVPPSRAEIRRYVAEHGAKAAYERFRVEVTGDPYLGYEVVVGDTGERAPAREYFRRCAFVMPEPNKGFHFTSVLLATVGGIAAVGIGALSSIGLVYLPIGLCGMVGCALPMVGTAALLNAVAQSEIPAAGKLYNHKLHNEIALARASVPRPPSPPAAAPGEDEELAPSAARRGPIPPDNPLDLEVPPGE